jgi:MFS family permease
MPTAEAADGRQPPSFWIPVICGAAILTIGIGARQSFGIFQKPIAADLKVGRELWSFANALAMLMMGAFSPFLGNLADRFGTARTVAAGGLLYVAGMFMTASASAGVVLTLGNVICGIGMAAAGFGPILGAVSRRTPSEERSVALGVTTAGGSIGQFAIVPFASLLQHSLDNWHTTMSILAVVSTAMVPLALGLREPRAPASRVMPLGSGAALQEAFGTRGFWLLTVGFFVCGFHVAFIGLHLPAYISDKAVGMTVFGRPVSALELGGWAVGLVGLFNLAGSLIWGWLGSRYPKKRYAGAALCTASAGIRDVSRAAIVVAVGAGIRRVARLPMARHSAADQRARRLHVQPDTSVDAVGHRVLQPPAGQLLWRLGRRPDLRPAGRLRADVVDLGRARRFRRPATLVHSRAAGAAAGNRRRGGVNRAADTPHRLLWVAGTAALLLCITAFMLWALGGAGILFDAILAFCT